MVLVAFQGDVLIGPHDTERRHSLERTADRGSVFLLPRPHAIDSSNKRKFIFIIITNQMIKETDHNKTMLTI